MGEPEDRLFDAVKKGDARQAAALIAKGADVNAKDNDGQIPLRLAVDNGYVDVADLLKAKGAKE